MCTEKKFQNANPANIKLSIFLDINGWHYPGKMYHKIPVSLQWFWLTAPERFFLHLCWLFTKNLGKLEQQFRCQTTWLPVYDVQALLQMYSAATKIIQNLLYFSAKFLFRWLFYHKPYWCFRSKLYIMSHIWTRSMTQSIFLLQESAQKIIDTCDYCYHSDLYFSVLDSNIHTRNPFISIGIIGFL